MSSRKREDREKAIIEDKKRSALITNADRLPVEAPKPKEEPKQVTVIEPAVVKPATPVIKEEPKEIKEEKVVRRGPKKTA